MRVRLPAPSCHMLVDILVNSILDTNGMFAVYDPAGYV
jgi:hypothetical protein